jgi:two-component system, OmpR family, catabolic regulation response regulator CreB
MKQHVLIIEDEPAIADTLIYALETEGFAVTWHAIAGSAEKFMAENPVNFIILDIGLPDQNGFELCKAIRQSKTNYADIPILFLTARKEEIDKIIGLEIGGDDYVTKPFSPREVTARVKAILKRISHAVKVNTEKILEEHTLTDGLFKKGKFQLELDKARVSYCHKVLALTRYEFLILQVLLANPERIFSRSQLMDKVWDEPDSSFERAVDTHIKSLRAKLREAADENSEAADPIKTHRGMGYSIGI